MSDRRGCSATARVATAALYHDRHDDDRERYQTVYATRRAVAAPTAGLHFDAAMLNRLEQDGHSLRHLTLHVGTGTFAPLRVDDLKDHVMHEEPYSVEREVADEYLANQSAVLAVGTTSLRILHTLRHNADNVRAGLACARSDEKASAASRLSAGGDQLPPYDVSMPAIAGRTSAFIYPATARTRRGCC